MVGAAADEVHHLSGVAALEAEQVDEELRLLIDPCAVEHHVGDLQRPRAVIDHIGMLRHLGGDVEHVAFRRAELEAVAAARARRQLRRRARDMGAEGLGLGVQRIDGVAVLGGEMHPQHRRLRMFAQRDDVVVGPVCPQVDCPVFGSDRFKAPDVAIERRGAVEMGHAELDRAHSGDFGVGHDLPLKAQAGPVMRIFHRSGRRSKLPRRRAPFSAGNRLRDATIGAYLWLAASICEERRQETTASWMP